jgi:hypothetical protein
MAGIRSGTTYNYQREFEEGDGSLFYLADVECLLIREFVLGGG